MLAYHGLFLLLFVGSAALFAGLEVLNLRYGERAIEEEAAWVDERLDVEDPQEVADYHRASVGLSLLRTCVGVGFVLLVLYAGLLADAVAAVESLSVPGGPIGRGVVFFVGATAVLSVLSWPFDAADTFVVEEIFGFNRQSARLWLRDTIVGLAVSTVLVAVLLGTLLVVVSELPAWWWLAGVGVFVGFSVAMQVVYPRVIAPLFYEFDQIEGGDLRAGIEDVFERAGFACEEIYVMDASRRSGHSNAYFIGFGRTKRVVLFDTLIDQMRTDQIQGVLAHELAHWKNHHIWKRQALNAVEIGVLLFALQYLMGTEWLYAMFGIAGQPAYAGLLVGGLFVYPVSKLLAPLSNRVAIAHEREADAFAVEVMGGPEPMVGALTRLVSENLSNPFPHPWYAAFNYTHPPVPDRIRYIQQRAGAESSDAEGEGAPT